MSDTDTQVRPVIIDMPAALDDGTTDPSEVAHFVDQRIDQDVTTAYIMGIELIALCGYKWIPTKDPQRLPVCQPCAVELERILS